MYELIDICFCFRPKVFPYVNGIHLLGTFELPQGAEKLFFAKVVAGQSVATLFLLVLAVLLELFLGHHHPLGFIHDA